MMDMDQIVDLLKAEIQRRLEREVIPGRTIPNDKEPINRKELKDRMIQLESHMLRLRDDIGSSLEGWGSHLKPDAPWMIEDRQLTAEEIRTLRQDDTGTVEIRKSDLAFLVARIVDAETQTRDMSEEVVSLIRGHWGNSNTSHGNSLQRAKEHGAFLLGFVESSGLCTTRDKITEGKGSCVEALQRAVRGVKVPDHETARRIHRGLPNTYDKVKNLADECNDDEQIGHLRSIGWEVGARIFKA